MTRNPVNINQAFSHCQLTSDQGRLLGLLESFLGGEEPCFLLKGYAGTGKTFMMQGVTRYLRACQTPFLLLAPTGRAAKVIAQKTGCPACTIHKAIYLMDDLKEFKERNQDGSEMYKYYFDLANNDDDARTVYIVDEASMVSNVYSEGEFFRFGSGHLLNDFLKYVNLDNNDHRKKIIFIGDAAQLSPVGSEKSVALDGGELLGLCGCMPESYELTEVVRQQEGSGILANATAIRDSIRRKQYNALDISTSHDDVTDLSFEDLLSCYLSACSSSSQEDTIIVAYSNSQVKDYNDLVREHRYPGQTTMCKGDRVLVVQNNYRHEIPLLNGEFGKVIDVCDELETRAVFLNKPQGGKRVNVRIDLSFREVVIRFPDLSGDVHDIRCMINERLLGSRERGPSSDERKALYVDFKNRHQNLKPGTPEFKEAIKNDPYFNCLQVKYGYAVTCHKAQGGEWKHVFVDFGSTMGYFNESYFRWAYTAVTRAHSHLYGLNTPHFGILTATGQPVEEYAPATEDVVCVDEAAHSQEINFEIPEDPPFLRSLFHAVSDMIMEIGASITDLAHAQYCEHYTFALDDRSATALIDYRKNGAVSHVRWKPNSDAQLKDALSGCLGDLEGKTIVAEATDSQDSEPTIEMPEGIQYLNDFFDAVSAEANRHGVSILEVRHPTQYLGRYLFLESGRRACVDFTFKGNGRLTRAAPAPNGTTSDELLQKVLSFVRKEGCK